jgi:hypothetical protein
VAEVVIGAETVIDRESPTVVTRKPTRQRRAAS